MGSCSCRSAQGYHKFPVVVVLAGLVFCCFLPLTESRHVLYEKDSNSFRNVTTTPEGEIVDAGDDDIAQSAEFEFQKFLNNTRSKFITALTNLSSFLPISVKYAVTRGRYCNIIKYNKLFYEKIPLILSGVLIVLGIIYCFFGYRLIKIVLFLLGFLVGFSIFYFIIIAFTHDRPEYWIPYVALASAAVVGILLGLLTICIYYIGIFFAGASIGFLVVWFIFASINVPFFRDHIYVPIIIAVVVGIAVGIIALLIQKWFFMFGTAVLGAFIIIWGLDYYLELGSLIYYLFLFAAHRSDLKPCWYSWILIPLFVILILAGFLVQALVTGRKYNHKKEMNGICCGLCRRKKKDEKSAPDGGAKYMKLKPVTE